MEIYGKEFSRKGDKKELKNYSCGYCNYKFKHYIRKVEVYDSFGRGSSASTQVKCPKCLNFLKTWD